MPFGAPAPGPSWGACPRLSCPSPLAAVQGSRRGSDGVTQMAWLRWQADTRPHPLTKIWRPAPRGRRSSQALTPGLAEADATFCLLQPPAPVTQLPGEHLQCLQVSAKALPANPSGVCDHSLSTPTHYPQPCTIVSFSSSYLLYTILSIYFIYSSW